MVRLARRLTLSTLAVALTAGVLVGSPSPAHAATPSATPSYSGSLTSAIASLPVASESRTGYVRTAFELWTDADGDGCDTREEVLIAEAVKAPGVGSGCALTGGSWYSYYDDATWTAASDVDIDHLVPLAEAWDSGAGTWSAADREAYANDLGDDRDLLAVTDNVNQSKGDRDIAEWTPTHQKCRYLDDWVAVKHRWGLSVDSAERSAMTSMASGCPNATITVAVVR